MCQSGVFSCICSCVSGWQCKYITLEHDGFYIEYIAYDISPTSWKAIFKKGYFI